MSESPIEKVRKLLLNLLDEARDSGVVIIGYAYSSENPFIIQFRNATVKNPEEFSNLLLAVDELYNRKWSDVPEIPLHNEDDKLVN